MTVPASPNPHNHPTTAPTTDPEQLLTHDAFVRGLARSLVRDPHGADDLVQDTWVAAIEGAPENPGSLRAWLGRVVRYLAGKRRRGEARRDRRQQHAARADYIPSTADIVEREAARRQVVRAVLELQEPYRTTMLLRFFENLPPREVARRLKVPVETVRTRIKRSLATLRARLDSLHGGDRQAWCLMLLPFIPHPTPAAVAATAVASLCGTCFTGILIMTTKAKLAAVAAICGVLLAALWALQGPSGEGGLPHDPEKDTGGARMVAEGQGEGEKVGTREATAQKPDSRTEVEERKPVARPTVGSLLVRAVWGDDKSPAAGVLLRTNVLVGGDRLLDMVYSTTDESGICLVEDLKPRRMYVEAVRGDMGGVARTTVVAGKQTEVTLEIRPGVNLKGIVVDQDDSPVAGADVIIAGWAGGQAVAIAKTGDDGRFSLRCIGTHCHVGARAPGHAPSLMHTIIGSKGGNLEVRLELTGRGGALEGKVLDPQGRPVAGAFIEIGEEKRSGMKKLPGGGRAKPMMPMRVRSDEEGRFLAEGLAPGKTAVAVRGQGLAPWRGEAEVLADGGHELVVRLLPGVTLAGTVRDGNARPAEKVEITVGDWGRLAHQRTRTDAHGKYRLEGLPVGKLTVKASHDKIGKTETELDAVAGQKLQWSPVISKGLVLRGRVVDGDNKPVHRAMVEARLQSSGPKIKWWAFESTDKEGRFELKNCVPDKMILMTVRARDHGEKRLEVKPGPEELVVRLSATKQSIYITGRVLDPEGKPVEACSITPYARNAPSGAVLTTDAGTGAFKYGPYMPGEWQLRIDAKGYPVFRTGWRKVKKDETWDLGTIRMQHAGFLQASFAVAGGGKVPDKMALNVLDAARQYLGRLAVEGGTGRSDPLAPGTYYVQVRFGSFAAALHRFEIQSGQDTPLDVTLEPGVAVSLEFAVKAKATGEQAPPRYVSVTVTDASGKTVFSGNAYRRRGTQTPVLGFAARPGKYKIQATGEGGKKAATEITVGTKRGGPVKMVLK